MLYFSRDANSYSERFFYHTKFSAAAEVWGFGRNMWWFFAVFISIDFWPTYIQSYLIKNEEEWSLIPLILYPRKSKGSLNFLFDTQHEEFSLNLRKDMRMSQLDAQSSLWRSQGRLSSQRTQPWLTVSPAQAVPVFRSLSIMRSQAVFR